MKSGYRLTSTPDFTDNESALSPSMSIQRAAPNDK